MNCQTNKIVLYSRQLEVQMYQIIVIPPCGVFTVNNICGLFCLKTYINENGSGKQEWHGTVQSYIYLITSKAKGQL